MDPQALLDFLGLSTGEVERMLLILSRVSGLFLAAPFFSRSVGPVRVRAILAMALTLVLFPLSPPWPGEGSGNPWSMAAASLSELVVGAMIGMLAHWVLVAMQVAGSIIGFEMGLSMAMVMDPTSGLQEGVLSNLLYFAGLIIFLSINGHHLLLEGLGRSFTLVPPGTGLPAGQLLLESAVLGLVRMFELSLLIAAPVIVSSKMLYLGMGLVNRASPQIQVFFLAMPLAQLLGLLVMGLSLAVFGQVLIREIGAFLALGMKTVGG
ncbi:MAG: flagellar biosynthetic protein FliR [Magnetococcus sp. WYHC-3]